MLAQVESEIYVDPAHVLAIAPAPMNTAGTYVYLSGGEKVYCPSTRPSRVRELLYLKGSGL